MKKILLIISIFCSFAHSFSNVFIDTVFLEKHHYYLTNNSLKRNNLIGVCGKSDDYYFTKRYFRLFYNNTKYRRDQNPITNKNIHKKNGIRKEVRKLGKKRSCYFKNEYNGLYVFFHKSRLAYIRIRSNDGIRLASGLEIGDSIDIVSKKLNISEDLLLKSDFSCYSSGLRIYFDKQNRICEIILWDDSSYWFNKRFSIAELRGSELQ